jgi:vancomycin resistance protein YoaR
MDGVLIAPGEEFSFNTQLGEVDAANGFVEGYAIIGNRTQLEWGGGVCQDSTTVFRAAFWAGLPITERHAHTFYISWYDRFGLGPNGDGQGLDAAIFTGVQDLKFLNDTGNWLLMQATVDDAAQVLTVRLYGTKPNREVRLEGPFIDNVVPAPNQPVYIDDPARPSGTLYQSDVARSGRDIVVYRVVVENGVEVAREQFFTRFKAWPNIFVRGTGS